MNARLGHVLENLHLQIWATCEAPQVGAARVPIDKPPTLRWEQQVDRTWVLTWSSTMFVPAEERSTFEVSLVVVSVDTSTAAAVGDSPTH